MDPEELFQIAKCPVCQTIPRIKTPIIFTCSNAHNVCKSCYDMLQVKTCPTARSCGFFDNEGVPQRNLMAEAIAEKWVHNCWFEEEGCKERGPFAALEKHEAECQFRVQCYESGCPYKGKKDELFIHTAYNCEYKEVKCKYDECLYKAKRKDIPDHESDCEWRKFRCPYPCQEMNTSQQMAQHFREKHTIVWEVPAKDQKSYRYSWVFRTNVVDPPIAHGPILFRERMFNLVMVQYSGFFHIWVYFVGSAKAAKDYGYELTFTSYKTGFQFTLNGPTMPADVSPHYIIKEGQCLIVSSNLMQNCMMENPRSNPLLSDYWDRGFHYYISFDLQILEHKVACPYPGLSEKVIPEALEEETVPNNDQVEEDDEFSEEENGNQGGDDEDSEDDDDDSEYDDAFSEYESSCYSTHSDCESSDDENSDCESSDDDHSARGSYVAKQRVDCADKDDDSESFGGEQSDCSEEGNDSVSSDGEQSDEETFTDEDTARENGILSYIYDLLWEECRIM